MCVLSGFLILTCGYTSCKASAAVKIVPEPTPQHVANRLEELSWVCYWSLVFSLFVCVGRQVTVGLIWGSMQWPPLISFRLRRTFSSFQALGFHWALNLRDCNPPPFLLSLNLSLSLALSLSLSLSLSLPLCVSDASPCGNLMIYRAY